MTYIWHKNVFTNLLGNTSTINKGWPSGAQSTPSRSCLMMEVTAGIPRWRTSQWLKDRGSEFWVLRYFCGKFFWATKVKTKCDVPTPPLSKTQALEMVAPMVYQDRGWPSRRLVPGEHPLPHPAMLLIWRTHVAHDGHPKLPNLGSCDRDTVHGKFTSDRTSWTS